MLTSCQRYTACKSRARCGGAQMGDVPETVRSDCGVLRLWQLLPSAQACALISQLTSMPTRREGRHCGSSTRDSAALRTTEVFCATARAPLPGAQTPQHAETSAAAPAWALSSCRCRRAGFCSPSYSAFSPLRSFASHTLIPGARAAEACSVRWEHSFLAFGEGRLFYGVIGVVTAIAAVLLNFPGRLSDEGAGAVRAS